MIIICDSVVKVVGRCSNFLTLTTSETLSHQGTHGFSGRSDAFFNFLRGEIEKHIYVMYIKGFQNPTTSTTNMAQCQ